MKNHLIGFVCFFLLSNFCFSQITKEKEEINAINDLLYEMIDADRLVKLGNTIVYFDLRQECNLNQVLKGDYKTNRLIDQLNRKLESKIIDSTTIAKRNDISLVFNDTINYEHTDYLSNNVIGTLRISRISFNKTLNVGYFYYTVYCGPDCGWGSLVKIKKFRGVWTIADLIYGYVS